jgi:hypothetical protein
MTDEERLRSVLNVHYLAWVSEPYERLIAHTGVGQIVAPSSLEGSATGMVDRWASSITCSTSRPANSEGLTTRTRPTLKPIAALSRASRLWWMNHEWTMGALILARFTPIESTISNGRTRQAREPQPRL